MTKEEQASLPGTVRPKLNQASAVAEQERVTRESAPHYPDPVPPDVIVSLDIETLALGPRPVITEVGMLGYDLNEGTLMSALHIHNYPVPPQQRIMPPREINIETLIFRSKSPNFSEELRQSSATDFEDLASLCRNLITVFKQLTDNGKANYELVCARPQFDIVAVETLLAEVGLEAPWAYHSVIDVRTMLKRAGMNHKNVPMPSGCVAHTAYGDARWQIDQYLAALRGSR